MLTLASQGELVLTLTAHLGPQAGARHPQPELWTSGSLHQQRGRQVFPIVTAEDTTLVLSGRHFGNDAQVFVDGYSVPAVVTTGTADAVSIRLQQLPESGLHFLQVQVPHGFISNDFIFHAAKDRAAALVLRENLDEPHSEAGAIRRALKNPKTINERLPNGSTPLNQAALWGQLTLVQSLLEGGARVEETNSDGNTALHVAAFMCHQEVVELLLEHGAAPDVRNNRGETALDVVSGVWTEGLAEFYRQLGVSLSLPVDTLHLQQMRPKIAALLRDR